jgi:hypothetical protein
MQKQNNDINNHIIIFPLKKKNRLKTMTDVELRHQMLNYGWLQGTTLYIFSSNLLCLTCDNNANCSYFKLSKEKLCLRLNL